MQFHGPRMRATGIFGNKRDVQERQLPLDLDDAGGDSGTKEFAFRTEVQEKTEGGPGAALHQAAQVVGDGLGQHGDLVFGKIEGSGPFLRLAGGDRPERPTVAASRGPEGLATSPDGSRLYALLEGAVTGDDPRDLRIYVFDVTTRAFAPGFLRVRLEMPSQTVNLASLADASGGTATARGSKKSRKWFSGAP